MAYFKINKVNALQELKRLARGKKTHLPVYVVAEWSLSYVTAETTLETTLPNDEVKFLKKLYRLDDPR